jgi:uncharacterized protein
VVLIHRSRDRAALPWKNGGGLTREVAVHPPASDFDTFSWRISLAEIGQGGPFSAFPGVERLMAVLAGQLEFSLAGAAPLALAADSAPVRFAGETGASAAPRGGAVSDLNVMTRRGECRAELTRHSLQRTLLVPLPARTTVILTLGPVLLHAEGGTTALAPLDAAQLEGVDRCELIGVTPGTVYVAEIFPAEVR